MIDEFRKCWTVHFSSDRTIEYYPLRSDCVLDCPWGRTGVLVVVVDPLTDYEFVAGVDELTYIAPEPGNIVRIGNGYEAWYRAHNGQSVSRWGTEGARVRFGYIRDDNCATCYTLDGAGAINGVPLRFIEPITDWNC